MSLPASQCSELLDSSLGWMFCENFARMFLLTVVRVHILEKKKDRSGTFFLLFLKLSGLL